MYYSYSFTLGTVVSILGLIEIKSNNVPEIWMFLICIPTLTPKQTNYLLAVKTGAKENKSYIILKEKNNTHFC